MTCPEIYLVLTGDCSWNFYDLLIGPYHGLYHDAYLCLMTYDYCYYSYVYHYVHCSFHLHAAHHSPSYSRAKYFNMISQKIYWNSEN